MRLNALLQLMVLRSGTTTLVRLVCTKADPYNQVVRITAGLVRIRSVMAALPLLLLVNCGHNASRYLEKGEHAV